MMIIYIIHFSIVFIIGLICIFVGYSVTKDSLYEDEEEDYYPEKERRDVIAFYNYCNSDLCKIKRDVLRNIPTTLDIKS